MRHLIAIVAGCLLGAALAPAAPDWHKEISPSSAGSFNTLPLGTLDLTVSWKGWMDAGRIQLDFVAPGKLKPGLAVVRCSSHSSGPAAALFPYRSDFWSEISPATLRPREFHATESDRKESVSTVTRFLDNRVETTEITKPVKKKEPSTRTRSFAFAPVHDIFSAMLHVRSQQLADGDRIGLVVHPFGTPYLVRIHVAGREKHQDRDAIRMTVSMRKINRDSGQLESYKKMTREATLWLSDDKQRIPLEVRAPVFIGDVRVTLNRYVPANTG